MTKRTYTIATLSTILLIGSGGFALDYEKAKIHEIHVILPKRSEGSYSSDAIAHELKTQPGHTFSQEQFDEDLKHLSKQFDRVDPKISEENGALNINIYLTPKPEIKQVVFEGNSAVSAKKLRKELGLRPGDLYDRAALARGITKIREYYVGKSYFETHISYEIFRSDEGEEVEIRIAINEGKSGRISEVFFKGVSKSVASDLKEAIYTKKYNGFTSWYTKAGTYNHEMIEHDKMTVISYMQNKGYADAHVDINIEEAKLGRIDVIFTVEPGPLYHIGKVGFAGNRVFSNETVEKHLRLDEGDLYSPERIQKTVRALKDLYGKKGYIDATITYQTHLESKDKNTYDITFDIHELEQYYIGTIKVIGNYKTNPNVVLNESLLVPGEVFDLRKLGATEERLRGTGFFKQVNIYPLKPSTVATRASHYRDVYIEVEEAPTGHFSLFGGGGSSGTKSVNIFGGVELIEKNFNISGLVTMFSNGAGDLRGGGEYLHMRFNVGQQGLAGSFSWMTPYAGDTLWRVGFDVHRSYDASQSDKYSYNSAGDKIYASYPLSSFWTFYCNYRIQKTVNSFSSAASQETRNQLGDGGILSGVGAGLNFDSTDHPQSPRRGLRSSLSADYIGLGGHFNYWKLAYLNTQYINLRKFGIFKMRGDLKFIQPTNKTPLRGSELQRHPIPLTDRFFLGGESTLRGFANDALGPKIASSDSTPLGGISYGLASLEYIYPIFDPVQIFAFYDVGTNSDQKWHLSRLYMSTGVGMRLNLLGQLPLTFGYGKVLNKNIPTDEKKEWFFSFGMQY